MVTAGSRVVSSELPPWFGLPDAPPVTIFGMVVGKRLPRSVHLSLAVPDPGIWPGRDVDVSPTGGFDFGPMRPGAYRVSAAIGDQCDIAFLDTASAPTELPSLVLEPCWQFSASLATSGGEPAAGIVVEDLTGRAVATTDVAGRFEALVRSTTDLRVAPSALHLPGWISGCYTDGATFFLEPGVTFTGTVVDADGAPVPRVGVQPIYGDVGSLCDDAPVVVTSDAAGRFSVVTDKQLCGIRIYRNRDAYEAPYLQSIEQHRPMMLREGALGDESLSRFNARSPVPRTYVVDPIEVRARDDGPLELVVRLARPQPRRGHAFAQLTAPPARD
jgi:hypothetical protein